MKILILNGPNLNLQGRRDVAVYGSTAFEEYLTRLRAVFPDVGLDCFQSNVEGELIDALHRSEGRYDGVVFNAPCIFRYKLNLSVFFFTSVSSSKR